MCVGVSRVPPPSPCPQGVPHHPLAPPGVPATGSLWLCPAEPRWGWGAPPAPTMTPPETEHPAEACCPRGLGGGSCGCWEGHWEHWEGEGCRRLGRQSLAPGVGSPWGVRERTSRFVTETWGHGPSQPPALPHQNLPQEWGSGPPWPRWSPGQHPRGYGGCGVGWGGEGSQPLTSTQGCPRACRQHCLRIHPHFGLTCPCEELSPNPLGLTPT